MKILIINGPNLNLLGARDASQYGKLSLKDIEEKIEAEFNEDEFEFFQSNIEGEIISKIQSAPDQFEGIILNPGGYTHTSVAIRDALEICSIPKIEVHLSNIADREEFRKNLITSSACNGHISGFKHYSYFAGIYLIKKIVN